MRGLLLGTLGYDPHAGGQGTIASDWPALRRFAQRHRQPTAR